jgi:DNA-binding response OmpR family regulator
MLKKILFVEDDETMRTYLKKYLEENGYRVHLAPTAVAALEFVKNDDPDLVILDLGLPDMSGESVCEQLRKRNPQLPIIILTARGEAADVVKGLNLGADDYIAKPFNAEELLARIKARLRPVESQAKLSVSDLHLDSGKFEVTRGGQQVHLTPQEYKLLEFLMFNKGKVLSRDAILNRLWLNGADVETRVVDVYIGYLRRKIDNGHKDKLIRSVRGFGYMITD